MSRYGPRCSVSSRTVSSKAPRMLEVIGPEGQSLVDFTEMKDFKCGLNDWIVLLPDDQPSVTFEFKGELFLEADLKISGRNCLDKSDIIKEPKNKHYGKLQVLDPKEEVVIEPVEATSRKVLFGSRRELTSKPHMTAAKSSLSIARTSSEKKNISSKSSENDSFTNSDNKLWSSALQEKTDRPATSYSAPKETTSQDALSSHNPGSSGQETATANAAKNNESTSQSPDKLSETTEGDDEEESSDECLRRKVAPLELMTEFLRAVMSRNYSVAKKLCQMILIYEPENPEAKQFSSLIEEKLLMEKTHGREDDEEEEEEEESDDSSNDSSEEESSDNDQSEDSSDESEDI